MNKALLLMAVSLMFFLISAPQAATAYGGPGGVNIHGFVSQGYLYSQEYNYLVHNSKETQGGSFEYSEMGVNFASQLTDKLRIGVQLFARDIGQVGNNMITLDWAYGDYRLTNWLGIRAGKIKLPLGFFNETRDMDMLRTCIVLPQGVYNDLLRDELIALQGPGLYGTVKLGPLGHLSYQGITGALNADIDSGTGVYLENSFYSDDPIRLRGEVSEPTRDSEGYAAALTWETPLSGLRVGYSLFHAVSVNRITASAPDFGVTQEQSIDAHSYFQYYSLEYTWRNLVVAAEHKTQESDADVYALETPNQITKRHIFRQTYYLMLSYRFTDLFTLGAYYSEFYPDMHDKDGDDLTIDHQAWEKDLALTLRFDINDYCIFKIEGHSVNGTANVLVLDNTSNDFDEEDWYYGAAKVTVSF